MRPPDPKGQAKNRHSWRVGSVGAQGRCVLVHVTLGIVDVMMVLIWAGLGALGWVVLAAGATTLAGAGLLCAVRSVWQRRRLGH